LIVEKNIKLILYISYYQQLLKPDKSFKHFFVAISFFLCTFATPKSRKNEENIPTITQKKSK